MSETNWDDVMAAGVRLQQLLPDAVLVGGTAAAMRASHRISLDDDHVLTDLRERFDDVLAHLEESEGWVTARVKRPVLILGSLDGVETGIRQLIRRLPLEVEEGETPAGPLRLPTLEEIDPMQVLRDVFAVIYRMNLRLPTRFMLLDRSIATLGSVGVELSPDFNVFEVATPYARSLMLGRFTPARVASSGIVTRAPVVADETVAGTCARPGHEGQHRKPVPR